MAQSRTDQKRIVFIFSDTGGGHRSAAQAIIEALDLEFPNRFATEMIDIFRQYAPPPLDLAPDIYPPLSRLPKLWELGYRISDGPRRMRWFYSSIWLYIRSSINRLVSENPCSLIVSVHQLTNAPVVRALRNRNIPFVTVVTDMVTTHASWYDARANLVIVPTEAARQRGINLGLRPEKMPVVGLPVAERFCQPPGDRAALRQKLGWQPDLPVILLVGGGEGMGPLEQVAQAIDHLKPEAAMMIVAGRNRTLKARLERKPWQISTRVYGFVNAMPDFMRAADILVTKAGPGTISEAFIAGLPMVLYSRMPGQEDGNVIYVVNEGAGVWAPSAEAAAGAVQTWLKHPEKLNQAAHACQRLARPQASRQIARLLAAQVETGA